MGNDPCKKPIFIVYCSIMSGGVRRVVLVSLQSPYMEGLRIHNYQKSKVNMYQQEQYRRVKEFNNCVQNIGAILMKNDIVYLVFFPKPTFRLYSTKPYDIVSRMFWWKENSASIVNVNCSINIWFMDTKSPKEVRFLRQNYHC